MNSSAHASVATNLVACSFLSLRGEIKVYEEKTREEIHYHGSMNSIS